MKSGIFRTIILFLFIITSATVSVAQTRSSKAKISKRSEKDVIQLFNGKDLSDWAFMLKDNSVDPLKVFSVQNGIIHITGAPFGYMRTKKSYSEYKLHAEWRWPAEATNSGIFINAQLPDTIWPRCFECQLAAGNAGDFICANGSDMNERIDKTKKSVNKMNPSNEKPVGEWNTMEVICKANTIEVVVNGVLQNRATGVSASEGFICLQSEGKDIEFRNLILTKLK
jgi:hypothetical protein